MTRQLFCLLLVVLTTSCSAINADAKLNKDTRMNNTFFSNKKENDEAIKKLSPSSAGQPNKTSTKNNDSFYSPFNAIDENIEKYDFSSLDSLDSTLYYFTYTKNENGIVPTTTNTSFLKNYDAYYYVPDVHNNIYLTFNCETNTGYTSIILDTLRDKNVKASFFVTGEFIEDNKSLIQRMIDEGHVIGNHSMNHITTGGLEEDYIYKEISLSNQKFKQHFGRNLDPFFRPPEGLYNERSLAVTQDLGYKTIFWSFSSHTEDLEKKKQRTYSINDLAKYAHDGCISSFATTSLESANDLGKTIDLLETNGYTFSTLKDLK